MNNGHGERRLMAFTVAVLVLYAPIETWYSMPELWDPFFLVDLAGMVLLVVGVMALRRDTVPRRLGMLIAGYAWTAANFWRAFFGRVSEVSAGGVLDYGALELCFTACILAATLAGLGWALVLSTRAALDGPG
jgi:hypothetical protein